MMFARLPFTRLRHALPAAGAAAAAAGFAAWAPAPPQCQAPNRARFAGKTVVITGGGGQMGREGAVYFAGEGANVVVVDWAQEALDKTVQAVSAAHPTAKVVAASCDVRSEESVKAAVGVATANFGKIDCLWNNAGVQGAMVPTPEYPLQDFKQVLEVNVLGAFTVLQAVAREMAATGGGAIVNTSSVAALRGTPTMVAYVSSKAALLGMTHATAKDLAPHGIRVNAVSPALIGPGFMWDRQNELHAASGSPYFPPDPEAVARSKVASVPMKRLGEVREVLDTVAFLLSEESSYTTGCNHVVAGGLAI